MNNLQNFLNEKIAWFPKDLEEIKPLISFPKPIYTSQTIKEYYIELLTGNVPDNALTGIKKLMDKNLLIPAITHTNALKYWWNTFFPFGGEFAILGCHMFLRDKKLYQTFVFFDALYSGYGKPEKRMVTIVTLHELGHFFFSVNTRAILNSFKSVIEKFYSSFLQKQFNITDSEKLSIVTTEIIEILKTIELNKTDSAFFKSMKKYFHFIDKAADFGNLDEKKKAQRINDMKDAIIYYISPNRKRFYKMYEKFLCVKNLAKSYKEILGYIPNAAFIQELIMISEVMAISAWKYRNFIFNLLSRIK